MRPRATIIGVEDSEINCLVTHLAFTHLWGWCSMLISYQETSICGPFEEYVLSNHLLSC